MLLAGAIEFTATEIAIILTLMALLVVGHLSALADLLLWPFALRHGTSRWPLGFVPLLAPHMAVHTWRMSRRWHTALAGTLLGSASTGALAGELSGAAAGPVGLVSLALLLAHYATRLVVAWHVGGRVDIASLGPRWLLMPVAWAVLPWSHLATAIRGGRPVPADTTTHPQVPTPPSPPARRDMRGPDALPPHPPTA